MRPKHKMDGSSPETKLPPTPRKSKSSMDKTKFKFEPPPEAPVFLPTLEEFENPLKYINKIRPIGQKTGICKIIPPAGWKVPFVLDMNKLKFTPRIQRINELEARTRIKLNFLDQLTKFYALKGKTFQIPIIEKRTLDLYTLHKLVREFGGVECVTKSKGWPEIAQRMKYFSTKTPPLLRTHYDHIIFPFITARMEAERKELGESDGKSGDKAGGEPVPAFRELKSLTFLGPGPKMAVCDIGGLTKSVKSRTRGKKIMYEFDPLAKYMCKSCSNGDIDEPLVTCSVCDDRYHSSCLIPPLTEANVIGWRCPKCVATEHCKSLEDFGFAQAEREYTLNEFKEMADKFKSNYFKCSNPKEIQTSKVESEFWRIVSSIEESVTVEYGADLHVIDHGSGFPIKNKPEAKAMDPELFNKYAESAWNLNNLPVLKASVLRHISADISGMKIPWMYAGMCFATFCWHNEDHWSYSINYLHMGEPKTWYGVPGSSAEEFEKAMRDEAPELFDSQPDILHQLVTIMDPNDIMKTGVPMYRTDQKEGEFVITFPRAYHAGFNQGFNFAEACNFAPYDWLHIGRECITHYSSLKRYCVFSHDELVCKMAEIYDELDKKILLATYKDMKTMVNYEHTKRRFLLMQGIRNASRVKFDELQDDERQCFVCKTTCFLSALVCKCNPTKLVCLDHYEQLCICPPSNYKLKFHYKIDELVAILYVMRSKVEHFDKWVVSVNKSSSDPNRKVYFRIFTELLIDSKDKEFTKDELLRVLEEQVKNCLKISSTAKSYLKNVMENTTKVDKKMSVDDLIDFSKELKNFPCTLTETRYIKYLVTIALKLKKTARKVIHSRATQKKRLKHIISILKNVNLEFDELPHLESKLVESEWIEKCSEVLSKKSYYQENVESLIVEGNRLPSTRNVLKQRHILNQLSSSAQSWTNKFNSVFNPPYLPLEDLKKISEEGNTLVYVKKSEKEKLLSVIAEARNVNTQIESVLSGQNVLYHLELKDLVHKAKSVPVALKSVEQLEKHILEINKWVAFAEKLFIKRNTPLDLMSILWPRRFSQRSLFYKRISSMPYRVIEGTLKENDHNFSKSNYRQALREQFESLFLLRMTNYNLRLETRQLCPCGSNLGTSPTLECELCYTVYHSGCFITDEKSTVPMLYNTYNKLLCSFCIRSKRPSFEKMLELVKEAKKLPVKIPECFVAEWNFQIAELWVESTHKVTESADFSSALQIMCANSKRVLKFAATKKSSSTLQSPPPLPSSVKDIHDFQQVDLNSNTIFELKYLILAVDCMEITTRENTSLWMILMASNLQRFHLSKAFIPADIEATSESIKTKMQVIKKNHSKLRKKPNIKRVFKKLKNIPDVTEALKNTCTTNTTSPLSNIMEPPSSPGSASVLSEHDEECAADVCQKPIEDSLDWVQCDGRCGQWFHMKCVDLTKQEITDDDDFICENCLKDPGRIIGEVVLPIEPFSPNPDVTAVDPLSLPIASSTQLRLY